MIYLLLESILRRVTLFFVPQFICTQLPDCLLCCVVLLDVSSRLSHNFQPNQASALSRATPGGSSINIHRPTGTHSSKADALRQIEYP